MDALKVEPSIDSLKDNLSVSLPPKTTSEEDLATAHHRQINLVWEYTQSSVAILVVIATIAGIFLPLAHSGTELIGNAFFLIIGFYFGRTNHTRS